MDKIEVINLVPKFLSFYDKAKEVLDSEQRWNLWKEHYNFAAVPPTEEGKVKARELFEDAWEKYGGCLDFIQKWQPNHDSISDFLISVKNLLGCEEFIDMVVVYFVGGFENNAFVAPYGNGRLALCLPIENGDSDISLVHELTHIVHAKTANLEAKWERTIANTILQEGLATQVSKALIPGKPDEGYIEHKAGWLESCHSNKREIIAGVMPYLDQLSSDVVYKFTMGNGTTNHEREAYYVGWEVVRYLTDRGMEYRELAKIKEDDMPDFVSEILSELV